MKKTIKLSLAAILAVAASVSCNKEQAISQSEIKIDGMRTVRIYSDVPSPTKTTLGENDQPLWKEGDEISVFEENSASGVSAEITNFSEDKTSGTILIPETIEGAFNAVYPADAFVSSEKPDSYDGLTDTVFVATVNIYGGTELDGSFGKANIAVGKSSEDGTSVQFKNAVALLEVTGLPGAGTLSLSKYNTALVDVSISKSADTLVTCAAEKPQGGTDPTFEFDVTSGGVYYIPVFPGTRTEELELTFTPSGQDATPQVMNLKTGVTLKRNVIYPVSWRTKKVTVQKYEDVNAELKKGETYDGIADDVPVQVVMQTNEGQDGDNVISFPVQTENKAINLVFIEGEKANDKITIKNDVDAQSPATLIISAPEGTEFVINTPNTHVVLNGKDYDQIKSITSDETLVISQGVTVNNLILVKGGLEVHGTLNSVEIDQNHGEIFVRDCEGLIKDVYDVLKPFIASGYKGGENGSKYDIVPAEGVAKIGDTAYASLENAIAAVQSGQTITLLTNVTNAAGISVPSGKNFTVDFGGYTYAMECPGAGSAGTKTAGFQLLENSTVVFKNGTIKCTDANKDKTWSSGDASKGIALMIQNYADLTLEDMTINATNIAHNGAAARYAISNNSGKVEFKGATSIISADGDYAFDVCKYGKYDKPVVTWNSDGTVNGVIELSGGDFIVAKDLKVSRPIRSNSNPSTLTVNSGVTVSPAAKFPTVQTAFANAGKTYKEFKEYTSGVVIVNRGGDLTINGEGTITSDANEDCYAAVCMTETGEDTGAEAKLAVQGNVTLEGYYYGIAGNGNRHNTVITISGGKVKGIETDNCSGIYHPQDGKLTINGGTIEGATGIYVKSGEVATVNGGTIKGIGTETNFEHNNSGAKVTGDAFIVENCGYPGGTPVVNISGGNFVSEHAAAISSYGYGEYPALTGFITGGTFNTQPAGDLIKEGYKIKKVSDDEYTVSKLDANDVATINALAYDDLATALSALKDGETLKIWKADTYTQHVNIPANSTLEGMVDGVVFEYTSPGSNENWIASCGDNATVKNVKWVLTKNDNYQLMRIANVVECTIEGRIYPHGTVVFKDCTFKPNGSSSGGGEGYEYAVTTWSSDATFKNCTFNTRGKAVNVYGSGGHTYTFDGCIFNATNIPSGKGKAGIFVQDGRDKDAGDETVIITNCTANYERTYDQLDNDPAISASVLWNVEKGSLSKDCDVKVYVDGNLVYTDDALVGISTIDQLEAFTTAVNGGNTYSGRTVTLLNDLDLSGVTVTPIATGDKTFAGTFDGNGKTISNMEIIGDSNGTSLFGHVFGATIKNLKITGAKVTNTAQDYTGILAGNGYANISGCDISGTVQGVEQVGAVIGYLSCGSITNCTVNANVTATTSRAGIIAGKANVDSEYKIEGNTVTGSATSNDIYAGGVVGQIMCATGKTWTIKNNTIGATVSTGGSLIGNVRSGQWDAFVAGYQDNVTGNTWTDSGKCHITDGNQEHCVEISK